MKSNGKIRSKAFILLMGIIFLFFSFSAAYADLSISEIEDQTGNEDTTVKVSFTLSGDLDDLEISVSSDNDKLIPDENIIHTGSGKNHTLTIVPEPDKYGEADIKVLVENDSESDSQTFTLEIKSIDDAPVVTIPEAQSIDENTELVFENDNLVKVDDIDAGNNDIELIVSAENGILKLGDSTDSSVTGNNTEKITMKGSLDDINDDLNGLVYTPSQDWAGEELITFTADDLGNTGGQANPFSDTLTDIEKLTVNVKPVNNPPVITIPGEQKTAEDTPIILSEENGNRILIEDPDAGDGEIEVSLTLENGKLAVSPDEDTEDDESAEDDESSEAAEIKIEGNDSDKLTLTGSLSQINNALDGLECSFDLDWNGTAELVISVDDKGNTGEGGPLTDTKTLEIIVEPVDDSAKITHSGNAVIDEDSSLAISVIVNDEDAGDEEIDIDINVENGGLEIPETKDVGIRDQGSGSYKLTGTVADINKAMEEMTYTPAANWNGTDIISIKEAGTGDDEEPGQAEIEIVVEPVNDAPVINNSSEIPMPSIEINEQDSPGESVKNIIKDLVEDIDNDETPVGIAVVSADNDNGLWMYSITPDQTWESFPDNLAEEKALLLDPDARIRFVPNTDWEGKTAISFRAWDLSGEKENGASEVDTTVNGETTPFSEAVAIAYIIAGDPDLIFPNAGPDQAVAEGVEVTLDGSASSFPSDAIVTFLWEQEEGTEVTLSDPAIEKPVFTAPMTEGASLELTFKLTLTNEENETFSDTVKITVKPASLLITAIAGEDMEVVEGDDVTLDASASVIPEDTEVAAAWVQTEGTEVELTSVEGMNALFTAPGVDAEGETLTFELILTDSEGVEYKDSITVVVKDSEAIEANAGKDMEVMEEQEVTLDGSASKIPAEAEVTFLWTQTQGTEITLSAADEIKPIFTAPAVDADEELIFELTLTDSEGEEYKDTVTIKIKDADAIIADAGENQTVNSGETVTLDASGSTIPEGVTPLYEWVHKEGKAVELSNSETVQATFIAPDLEPGQEENLVFNVTISDNDGHSDNADVTITVKGEAAPGLPVANAGTDQNVYSGDNVILDASGSSDPDGEIVEYLWAEITEYGIELSTPDNVTASFTAPSGGETGKTLQFKLIVTDNDGNTAENIVAVNIAGQTTPEPPDQGESFNEGQTITLSVSDAGNIGNIVSYYWEKISGPDVELSDSNSSNPTFIAPSVGPEGTEIVFKVTLTDENGATSTDTITIGVNDNGITNFPADVLAFTPVQDSVMGIKVERGKLIKLSPFDPANISDQDNRPSNLIYGLIDMEIKVENPGDEVSVTIYLENAAPSGYKWFKYSFSDGWYDFSENSVFNSDRTQITLTMSDGGIGDDDGQANGIIKDPSGLGTISDGTTDTPDTDSDGPGDSDSGCFIKTINTGMLSLFN